MELVWGVQWLFRGVRSRTGVRIGDFIAPEAESIANVDVSYNDKVLRTACTDWVLTRRGCLLWLWWYGGKNLLHSLLHWRLHETMKGFIALLYHLRVLMSFRSRIWLHRRRVNNSVTVNETFMYDNFFHFSNGFRLAILAFFSTSY